jgi:hypothetical protein
MEVEQVEHDAVGKISEIAIVHSETLPCIDHLQTLSERVA